MKSSIIALCLLFSSVAAAKGARQNRPLVCADYSLATTGGGAKVALCESASGKQTVLTRFSVVTLTDESGAPLRVVVGFR